MISCIFTTAFYAIVIFADAINSITTIISNLQTNFDFIPRALYRVFQRAVRDKGYSEGEFLTGWSEQGVILSIRTFPIVKQHSADTEHQLKLKLA